jgi:hypothetical protein
VPLFRYVSVDTRYAFGLPPMTAVCASATTTAGVIVASVPVDVDTSGSGTAAVATTTVPRVIVESV